MLSAGPCFDSEHYTGRYIFTANQNVDIYILVDMKSCGTATLELRKIRIALTVLLSIPEPDCFTALQS